MKLTILGCHSATPRWDAHPTSQLLEVSGHLFLIDCGEGTQVQLRRYKIKFARIKHIFISHLHGDHFFGLVGLVSTFRLLGREADLHIYGPKGIKEAITVQLKLGKSWTNYGLYFHELDNSESEIIFEDEAVSVRTIPLNHRVYTNGFLIKEKVTERPLNIQACREHQIDKSYFNKIKQGGDIVGANGELIKNALLTQEPKASKSYAFCSDTMYHPSVIPIIKGATMLYHEATFLESHKEVAVRTKHSTAKDAAAIAKEAEVGGLIVGHYSGRYGDHEMFKTEAQELFENVILGKDGLEISF
jgi:ribonuclease Z